MTDEIRAEGERSVAIGGDASGATIITGDQIFAKTEQEELQEALKAAIDKLRTDLGREIRRASKPPDDPYRFLDFFELKHRSVFYGRETALNELLEKILGEGQQNRLTLLHAPSGAGKSSLLRAGIVPALFDADPPPLPLYIHHPHQPTETIKRTLLPKAPHPEKLAAIPLRVFLEWACGHLEHREWLVILLDQFEEFFIHLPVRQRELFVEDLSDCFHAENLPVKFVLAMRKDYFSDMTIFGREIESVFHNEYQLKALTRTEARQAIEAPLDGPDIAWVDGAVEKLLDYLEQDDHDQRDGIDPASLQLICSRLYKSARENNQNGIKVEVDKLEAIHAKFLEDEMSAISPPAYTREQNELAWKVLKSLVTSRRTTLPTHLEKLYELAPKDEVDPVLSILVNRRLLRRNTNEGKSKTSIEVVHDTLAQKISAHETETEIRTKAARELISRGLDDWLSHGNLMDQARLRLLDEYRDVLALPVLGSGDREGKALEFLLRSALAGEHEIPYWVKLAQEGAVDVRVIFRERLGSEDFQERAAAVKAMALVGLRAEIPTVIERLMDPYPRVRAAAIHALEKLQPTGEWLQHLVHECYVPAGNFIMGDDYGDRDKKPVHKVSLEAFYIAKTPVTNAEYKLYRNAVRQPFEIPNGKEHHPVTTVSWYEARDYAAWAGMRLPTEAEWEKAASWDDQQKVKRKYPWGNEFEKTRCNTIESGKRTTTPVNFYGEKGASPCSAWDMAGNVWEWCSSLYKNYPYDPDDGREDPTSTDRRVLRGGSFFDESSLARCESRYNDYPSYQWRGLGFRVVCGASPISSPDS